MQRKVDLFGAAIRKVNSSYEEATLAIASVDSTDRCFSVALSHYDKVLLEIAFARTPEISPAEKGRFFHSYYPSAVIRTSPRDEVRLEKAVGEGKNTVTMPVPEIHAAEIRRLDPRTSEDGAA